MIVFLDSGVIGLLSNPNKREQVLACENWLYGLLAKGNHSTGNSTVTLPPSTARIRKS